VGGRKLIILSPKHWELCKLLGTDNHAQGIRKAMNLISAVVEKNLEKAAQVLEVPPICEDIEAQLLEFFPALETGNKGVSHLMSELMFGEAFLFVDEESQTINRVVNVLELKIYSDSCPGKVIKERKQVWHKTGETVERDMFVSEKIQNNANIETEIERAISEELSLSPSCIEKFEILSEKLVPNPKSAYKGLDSYSKLITVEVWITGVQPQDTYIEKQSEKDIYFQWVNA
jgi:hypothetical protein